MCLKQTFTTFHHFTLDFVSLTPWCSGNLALLLIDCQSHFLFHICSPILSEYKSAYPPVSPLAPVSCDAFKTCLMRIPHTSECLGNINAFFKENGISRPKLPSMPTLPTQISDVTKYLPSLPPELRQEFSHIRLTQVPRNIGQTLTELLPRGSEGAVGPSLSSLYQSCSSIPQRFSQVPSRTQQYFLNVQKRLNSLMPQDA